MKKTTRSRTHPLTAALVAALGIGLHAVDALAATRIAVTTADDAGTTDTCTLRQAIAAMNDGGVATMSACVTSTISGIDTIVFDTSVFPPNGANAITLADTPNNQLTVTDTHLVVDASANGNVTVQRAATATNAFGILYAITSYGTLTLDSLTIANGKLTASQPSGAALGAGIASVYTTLTLDNSVVSGNDNASAGYAAGGGIAVYAGDLVLNDSTVGGNHVSGNSGTSGMGGGVFVRQKIETQTGGNATIADSRIIDNTAQGNGGGLHVGGALTLIRSQVSGNSAGKDGGGIKLYGTSTLTDSTIRDNTATRNGGGILAAGGYYGAPAALLTLDASTVSGNHVTAVSGSRGGGLFTRVGNLSLINSTLAGNSTAASGYGYGGAIYVKQNDFPITLRQTTIASNTAARRGGGLMIMSSGAGAVTFDGSLFANTDAPSSGGGNIGVSIGGITVEGDGNLVFPGAPPPGDVINAAFSTAPINGDPKLGPLADNGGPTQTMLPGAGSAAVDAMAATDGRCPLATDQRGMIRPDPAGAQSSPTPCDIGAVEAGSISDAIFADGFDARRTFGTGDAAALVKD